MGGRTILRRRLAGCARSGRRGFRSSKARTSWGNQGKLTPVVAETYALEDIHAAQAAFRDKRTAGNFVIRVTRDHPRAVPCTSRGS